MTRAQKAILKRLLACLAGSLVLALMVGDQEGTQEDYGLAFREAILKPRVFVFLGIGVLLFLAITFWPLVSKYIKRTGVRPLGAGAITVVASLALLKWFDPLGKFSALAQQASNTNGLSPLAKLYYTQPIAWLLLLITVIAVGAAIIMQIKAIAWVGTALGVIGALWSYLAHHAVTSYLPGQIDHSLGAGVAVLGYLTMAAAAATVALQQSEIADTQNFIDRVLAWRPGAPLIVLGLIVGLISFSSATWFDPNNKNATLVDTHTIFQGTSLAPLAVQYLIWLGWLLFGLTVVATAAGSYLRIKALAWAGAALGVIAVLITLITMYDFTKLAADQAYADATGPWQNLGTGGWLACIAFTFLAGGGVIAALGLGRNKTATKAVSSDQISESKRPGLSVRDTSMTTKSLLALGVGLALFYPPTATDFWQKALVTDIGVYVLLAIGLNVVVGWAGLLDLGFIAFYAIGSYTTAYLVGSLPHKPPSFLHFSPLVAIPFAIVICLIAGVLLGAPTLRLRGDYLAIVTLGFGEIIRIVAINNPGNSTNSTRGPSPAVPHPVVHIGPLKWTWGLNNLQYWYLLLFLIVVVFVLFYRLEGSRLGRAWAAIREDEIAAQASGINTTKVKLLAFAIGASTSGLAGVFFASQVGYFNPDNFVLNNSILVVAYVVFGGMGSLPGAMAGAAVLTWLPDFLRDQVPADDRQMWIGAILLAMMIFRPAGLIPAKRRRAELSGFDAPDSAESRAVPVSEGL